MGVPVGFTYFYLFAEDFGMGAVRTAGRSAAPAAAGTRMTTKVSALVNPVSFIPNLAKIRERRPLRKGERQRIFSSAWTRVARHVSTYSQGRIPCCYTYGFIYAGATQGELPEGQERVPWGITVLRNPLACYSVRHLRI